MEPLLECDVTDIEIGPDGRLFLFGASRELLELLAQSGIAPEAAGRRLAARDSSQSNHHAHATRVSTDST
jgi:hypothetical protein